MDYSSLAGGYGNEAADAADDVALDFLPGDPRIPRVVAAAIVGSAITLILLRTAGFRFSFGASLGGGS
jgi:hypothetical protein